MAAYTIEYTGSFNLFSASMTYSPADLTAMNTGSFCISNGSQGASPTLYTVGAVEAAYVSMVTGTYSDYIQIPRFVASSSITIVTGSSTSAVTLYYRKRAWRAADSQFYFWLATSPLTPHPTVTGLSDETIVSTYRTQN